MVNRGFYYSPVEIVRAILKGDFEIPDVVGTVNNKTRQKIIRFCHGKQRTISEIMRHLKLSYNPTWKHIKKLSDAGLVVTQSAILKKVGAVVYVRTIDTRKRKPISLIDK